MSTLPPPPPPPLVDDLIREILLRLPPDDPSCLVRACLACKPWRCILTDPGFRRRYREFHRAPPMLGFLRNIAIPGNINCTAQFVPTSTFRPAGADRRGRCAIASGHGRVLLHTDPFLDLVSLEVWDPVTGEQWALPRLPVAAPSQVCFNAVVLCSAAGCDHLDCHGGPFAVAYVGLRGHERSTFACLYSSETGEWGKPAKLEEAAPAVVVDNRPGVLVGDAVYFLCNVAQRIVKYDMGRGELSVIDTPFVHRSWPGSLLTVTEDGKLGLTGISFSSLYQWSREAGPDGALVWAEGRVIDLDTMLLYFYLGNIPVRHVLTLIGFADGPGLVFVMTEAGRVFSVELKSGFSRKTSFPKFHHGDSGREPILTPYMSFYNPDRAKDLRRREEA